jgi:hypothetical protein
MKKEINNIEPDIKWKKAVKDRDRWLSLYLAVSS